MEYRILNEIFSPQDIKTLTVDKLDHLANDIRKFLIENVTQTGGHLAPNLGVVELTIALHYVFNSPEDSLIWDVGHQAYVHKILTGRKELFPSLRTKNGLSGYPSPQESIHDVVHAGHSSTSVSLGVGIATAKKMAQNPSSTIAIIGDGAFTSGMVYEALNDASWRNIPLIIILNDNKMSISENVGGIAKHLDYLRTNKNYLQLKRKIYRILDKSRLGRLLKDTIFQTKSSIKKIIFRHHTIFDNLGVKYLGPFDGHDLRHLINLFSSVKNESGPVLLHIITQKGLGHTKSENNPINFHGISAQDDSIALAVPQKTRSQAFGESLIQLAEENPKIIAITAAMREGTGLAAFAKKFPDRFIDVGIAEQHAVTLAAGLAIQGYKPIVAIYSTFLQRAYDQLVHDVGIGNYPVIFCLDRAGVVPGDGKTHQGIFDIAFLRTIPNITITTPVNQKELLMLLQFALEFNGPFAIRYPKDTEPDLDISLPPIELGMGFEIKNGSDTVVVLLGSLIEETLNYLQENNLSYAVYQLRFAKPVSEKVIEYLRRFSRIIVVEEGIQNGGVGEYLMHQLHALDPKLEVVLKNIGDTFPDTDSREGLLAQYGLAPLKL